MSKELLDQDISWPPHGKGHSRSVQVGLGAHVPCERPLLVHDHALERRTSLGAEHHKERTAVSPLTQWILAMLCAATASTVPSENFTEMGLPPAS